MDPHEHDHSKLATPPMASPHALVIPYPAQGHVIPLIELSYCMIDHGFTITFANTDFNHKRVVAAMSRGGAAAEMGQRMHLVSVPDGLGPEEDRNDPGKVIEGISRTMPGFLEELIREKAREGGESMFTCMVVDQSVGSILEVAKKTGLRAASFFPACAAILAMFFSIPKLIQDEILNADGAPMKHEMIQLIPGMPPMDSACLFWNLISDAKTRQIFFENITNSNKAVDIAEFIICNTFFDIELAVFNYAPNILPVGPLLTGHRFGKPVGHFWPEDTSCTTWLDEQPTNSVVYIAFGSCTIFDQTQFQELALGLELMGRRFLWVVRPDLADGLEDDAYPEGFRERVIACGRGRIVGWAPQQRVLAHPSIACFVTHCGWNSTMEGVRNGVRFLCWPCFGDQFFNQSYICDIWKTGLRLTKNVSGIIPKEEIKMKLDELIGDEEMKTRALELKKMAHKCVSQGGSSHKNFNNFIDAMKQ